MWWIIAAIVAIIWIPWLISVLARRPLGDATERQEDNLAMMHDRALLLYRAGEFDTAEAVLKEAVERSPVITEGTDADADLRFKLVLMLASVAREWHADLEKELALLKECAEIVETGRVETSPPSDEIIKQFDRLSAKDEVPAALASRVRTAEAIVRLHRGNVVGARDACAHATRVNPSDRLADIMLELLMAPDTDPKDVLSEIWRLIDSKKPIRGKKPLGPLPEGIVERDVWERMQHLSGDSAISDEEFQRFEAHAEALAKSAQYARQEALVHQMLERHSRPDVTRVNLLQILARALMRQDKNDEALTRAAEAIALAHRCNDTVLVAMMLDLRAEILCFDGEHVAALRALEAAEQVLRDSDVQNVVVDTWIAHTKGMAYAGCGWWDASAVQLQKAMEGGEQLRNWTGWAGAAGDFVGLTLRQTQSEGPDVHALEKALELLERIGEWFSKYDDRFLALQARLDTLRIRSTLSILRRDVVEMWKIRDEFDDIMAKAGGREGFFNEPGNSVKLVRWTVDQCHHQRAMIEIRGSDRDDIKTALDQQLSLLERATSRAPRVASLWHEKAALHLFRGRQRLDDATAALHAAADCVETVMDIHRSIGKRYVDPEVRAGWIGALNQLFETLGDVASFALDEVDPPSPDIAARMIALAQYLRARSRHDLTRSVVGGEQQTHDRDIADLFARIRLLHRWRDRLSECASDRPSRDSARATARAGEPSTLLDTAAVEIIARYPEYSLLLTAGHVDDELKKRKNELKRRVVGRSLLRIDSARIEEESPFDLSEFQTGLRDGEVVLDYYLGPHSLHAAIISRSSVDMWRLPVDDMRAFCEIIRKDLYPSLSLATTMRKCSAWLLPESLVSLIDDHGASRIYIVASGPLWSVPFPWLDAAGLLVVERWETCIVPSARFAGIDWTAPSFRASCAIGHPGEPPLAGPELEVNHVAKLLQCPVLFGAKATPREILSNVLPNAEVLHFACHGTCDPVSPLTSCLHLEPDDEHPDGLLMLYEILQAPLRASLVSLGACHTARVEGPTSFPESIAHAFLGGNAQFVVASLWEAPDKESRAFAERFYGALNVGSDPAAAFRHAQLEHLESLAERRGGYSFTDADFARSANQVLLSARRQERSAS